MDNNNNNNNQNNGEYNKSKILYLIRHGQSKHNEYAENFQKG